MSLLTACSKLVDNLGQEVGGRLDLLADLLQDVRLLRVYRTNCPGKRDEIFSYKHKTIRQMNPAYRAVSLSGPARFILFVRSAHDFFFRGGGVEGGILLLQKVTQYENILILFYTSRHSRCYSPLQFRKFKFPNVLCYLDDAPFFTLVSTNNTCLFTK
jgi:hypothetical protein